MIINWNEIERKNLVVHLNFVYFFLFDLISIVEGKKGKFFVFLYKINRNSLRMNKTNLR